MIDGGPGAAVPDAVRESSVKFQGIFRTGQRGRAYFAYSYFFKSRGAIYAMPATIRQIVIATLALVSLTVVVYVATARTATAPQGAAYSVAALPIGIGDLMESAKDLPEQRYDAF